MVVIQTQTPLIRSLGKPIPQKISPLPYVGAKSKAIKIIGQFMPPTVREVVSPFFGGGSFEIWLAKHGITVTGYDGFRAPVDVINCWIADNERLSTEIAKHEYVIYNRTTGKEALSRWVDTYFNTDIFARSAAWIVFSAVSYNAQPFSGGFRTREEQGEWRNNIKDSYCKWYLKNKAPELLKPIEWMCWQDALANNPDKFAFIDPPYLFNDLSNAATRLTKHAANYYGLNGSHHKDFEHEELRDVLTYRDGWIMTNANNKHVRELYQHHKIVGLQWLQASNTRFEMAAKELLIFSRDLDPCAILESNGLPTEASKLKGVVELPERKTIVQTLTDFGPRLYPSAALVDHLTAANGGEPVAQPELDQPWSGRVLVMPHGDPTTWVEKTISAIFWGESMVESVVMIIPIDKEAIWWKKFFHHPRCAFVDFKERVAFRVKNDDGELVDTVSKPVKYYRLCVFCNTKWVHQYFTSLPRLAATWINKRWGGTFYESINDNDWSSARAGVVWPVPGLIENDDLAWVADPEGYARRWDAPKPPAKPKRARKVVEAVMVAPNSAKPPQALPEGVKVDRHGFVKGSWNR